MLSDETEPHRWFLAKYALAFFKISFSISRCLISALSCLSSASSGVGCARRQPGAKRPALYCLRQFDRFDLGIPSRCAASGTTVSLLLDQPHCVQLEFHFILPHYALLTHPDSFRDVQLVSTLGVRSSVTNSSRWPSGSSPHRVSLLGYP